MESTDQEGPAQAFKLNRIAAIVMVFAVAATLVLLRPELSLVYIAFLGIAVYLMTWAGTRGLFGQPRAVMEQNFTAYVAISTMGFVACLFVAPQVIDIIGNAIYIAFAIVILLTILRAFVEGN